MKSECPSIFNNDYIINNTNLIKIDGGEKGRIF